MELLKNLGLSYYESRVLEITLSKRVTLKELSEKTKIPFGKVYSIVKLMIGKGLLEETNERPKYVYVADPTRVLERLIEEKQQKGEAIVQKVRDLATELPKLNPEEFRFFQIGTSRENNNKIQLRTFLEAKKEVCQILNIYHNPKMNRQIKIVWEKEIAKATQRGVKFRSIYPKKVKLPAKLQAIKQGFNIRRLDTDFVRCDIIDRKKVLIKFTAEDAIQFVGVLFVENEKLARNFQNIFEQFWEQAKH